MSQRSDEELIQAVFDRSISKAEFGPLEDRLREDDAFRALFQEYARLNHILMEEFQGQALVPHPQLRSLDHRAGPRQPFLQSLLSAAAIVMALLGAAYFITTTVRPPVIVTRVLMGPETAAQIIHEDGRGSTRQLHEGSTLTIARGTVALTLASGVEVLVEGPALVIGGADNALTLREGRAWFRVPPAATGFTCTTRELVITDLGTEFGVLVGPDSAEEIHVFKGQVQVQAPGHPVDPRQLQAGEGLRWDGSRFLSIEAKPTFATSHPEYVQIFSDDFSEVDGTPLHGKDPDLGPGPWQTLAGQPLVMHQRIDTSGHSKQVFAPLDRHIPLDERNHILLLTIRTTNTDARNFQSEGWAGVSLFTGEDERIFVGNPSGSHIGWAIHPVGGQPVAPSPPLQGKHTVTLRYDYRTGLTELFAGTNSQSPPLASEWIPAQLPLDRIRIANAEGGDIAIDLLRVSILVPPEASP